MAKFLSILAEELYEAALEGGENEQLGTSEGFGWHALFTWEGGGAIVYENSQGFVGVYKYSPAREAERQWAVLREAHDRYETLTMVDSLDTSCDGLFLIISTSRHVGGGVPDREAVEDHVRSCEDCFNRNAWALEV